MITSMVVPAESYSNAAELLYNAINNAYPDNPTCPDIRIDYNEKEKSIAVQLNPRNSLEIVTKIVAAYRSLVSKQGHDQRSYGAVVIVRSTDTPGPWSLDDWDDYIATL